MRRNYVPWRAAGTTTELKRSADEVVRETGWVFNNDTGSDLSLAEFVETGNHETLAYLTAFGLGDDDLAAQTLVEIGCGDRSHDRQLHPALRPRHRLRSRRRVPRAVP